jgi:hypothetical protein
MQDVLKIEERIFTVRGKQVILDRDLAQLYGVETKVLNQAVRRNIERFPESFMFKLYKEELKELVTICDRLIPLKHSTVLPYAFTEQGVSMLSAVLRSPTAIQVSIQIMESFVKMRQYISMDSHLFKRINSLEMRVSDTEIQVANVIKTISSINCYPKQGIFFDGQVFDAYTFVSDLVRKAVRRIVLIDNYVDDTVLKILDKRLVGVTAIIYTSKLSEQLKLDIAKHNSQYPPVEVSVFYKAHDRFLIIDGEVYLIGASIKDLGKKWFGFTLMENTDAEEMLGRIV